MKDGFQIKWFEDYHEIPNWIDDHKTNGAELGCFYAKRGPKYAVYFGVFWNKGRCPPKEKILKRLNPLLRIQITLKELNEEFVGNP